MREDRRAHLLISLALLLTTLPLAGQDRNTQPATTALKRIGVFFWHDSPNDLRTFEGIRQGLIQAGLQHTFLAHQANSDPEKAKQILASLQQQDCELVIAMGTKAAQMCQSTFKDVPILFAAVSDPMAAGLVRDWSGSGTNLFGASSWIAPESVLEVFHLAVPECRRIGMLRSADEGVVSKAEHSNMLAYLKTEGAPSVELIEAVCKDASEIHQAVETLLAANVDAIWIPIDITIYRNLSTVHRALSTRKIPLVTTAATGISMGAVVGAVVDYRLHGRRAAALAVQVLVHGKEPSTLPIDRLRSTQVTVNLAAARQLELKLPLSLLVLADTLIDPDTDEVNDGR